MLAVRVVMEIEARAHRELRASPLNPNVLTSCRTVQRVECEHHVSGVMMDDDVTMLFMF